MVEDALVAVAVVFALPILGQLLLAMLLAVVAWVAGTAIAKLLYELLTHLPIPGINWRAIAADVAADVTAWARSWLEAAAQPLNDVVDLLSGFALTFARETASTLLNLRYRLGLEASERIAGDVSEHAYTGYRVDQEREWRISADAGVRNYSGALVSEEASQRLAGDLAQYGYTAYRVGLERDGRLAGDADERHYTEWAVGTERNDRLTGDYYARQYAAGLTATEAATRAAGDVTERTYASTAVATEAGQRVAGDEATYAAAALAAAALVRPVATSLETMRRTCVDPSCAYLGPQLGALMALQDVALIGALFGIVGAAARDPAGTASAVVAGTAAVRDLAAGLAGEITGVRA